MSIQKELEELVDAKVISEDTSEAISHYYASRPSHSGYRLIIAFSILGALLVGMGIILIIAHNWDDLSKTTKSILAFLPLVVAQVLCAYSLVKRKDSVAWREGSSILLVFSVGACIALISQIYNIEGELSGFLLTWTLLVLPLIYVMRSSFTSLLYLAGITFYACSLGYWTYPNDMTWMYWPLLLAAFPHYYLLSRREPKGNFTRFHHWLWPLSIVTVLGTFAQTHEYWMFPAYMSLFGIFAIVGETDKLLAMRTWNSYKWIAALGSISILLALSYPWFWKEMRNTANLNEGLVSISFLFASLFTVGALLLLWFKRKAFSNDDWLTKTTFIPFLVIFFVGFWFPLAVWLINTLVLALGILMISEGAKKAHLGLLNYGLLIVSALVVCRFFDTNISFVIRGMAFLLIGAGFFLANFWVLKKRKHVN